MLLSSYLNSDFLHKEPLVVLLDSARLCHLATQADGIPHLSLMNFTYSRTNEVIIISTRRNTRKFIQIAKSPQVSVLIHDFPILKNNTNSSSASSASSASSDSDSNSNSSDNVQSSSEIGRTWSITISGLCEVS